LNPWWLSKDLKTKYKASNLVSGNKENDRSKKQEESHFYEQGDERLFEQRPKELFENKNRGVE